MPLSYQNHTGDGNEVQFSINFEYQNTTEISVTVDGVVQTGLTFPSSGFVVLEDPPVAGAIVQVRRTTDLSARAVDFASGSVLTEEDLDNSAIQTFHAAQEAKDVVNDTITLDTDLKWEADNKVIKNVANPVNLQDAATKNYIENTWLTTSDKAQLNSLNIANLNSVATNLTDVNTVATNISDVNAFAQVYRSGATDPTTSLDVGDLFYNTTSNLLKIWNGSSWETGVQGASGLLALTGGTMTGDIAFSGSQTVDGRDLSEDGSKLDTIESNATADQTGAEIKALYEAEANAFTDAQFTKLDGIEELATADQTASEIRALVESASDSNVFTDDDHTKLNGIADGATVYSDNNVDTHLNTSTASASEVLSWTGSDYDWVSTGTKLFDESYDGTSTLPSATGTNTVAVGVSAVSSNTESGAFGFASRSSGLKSLALGNAGASGDYSTAINVQNNTTNYGAIGDYSTSIGYVSKASRDYAISIGGAMTLADGEDSIAFGRQTSALANRSVAIGTYAHSNIVGKFVFSNNSESIFGRRRQGGYYLLYKDTTNATPAFLTTDGNSIGAGNQIILYDHSAYSFSGTIIAREDSSFGTDYAAWEIKGALLRGANAASTVLGNGIKNKLYATSGASSWAIDLIVDTTYGGLKIEATGAAGKSIRFQASVNTSEVTYT
jgi:hypothetical protein